MFVKHEGVIKAEETVKETHQLKDEVKVTTATKGHFHLSSIITQYLMAKNVNDNYHFNRWWRA